MKNSLLDITSVMPIEQPVKISGGQLEMGSSWWEERRDWGWRYKVWSCQGVGI